MTDTPDSIKIKMLEDAGFHPIPLQEKYVLLVDFLKDLSKSGCCNVCQCKSCDALKLLREIGESE